MQEGDDSLMAMNKELLLSLAYRLLEEPPLREMGAKKGTTAVKTVAGIFRDVSRSSKADDRMHKALTMVEALAGSPLARYGMRQQYEAIISALEISRGRVNHPDLKGLSFDELAYVLGWLSRIFHAQIAGVSASGVQTRSKNRRLQGDVVKNEEKPPLNEHDDWKKVLMNWANKQKL